MQARSEAYKQAVTADGREMVVRAVVEIVDPDMEQGAVSGPAQDLDVTRPEQLWDKNFEVTARYAALEPCRWVLDGGQPLLPDRAEDVPDWEAGMVGLALSGADGTFGPPQVVQISFSGVRILQACAVAFSDRPEDGVGEDFTVEVLSEGTAYHTEKVRGNREAVVSVTGFTVIGPDAIRVTVERWSLPGRRMRVAEVVPGVYEVWSGDQVQGFALKQQCDPSCLTLPYGTCSITLDDLDKRFDPRSKTGVFQMIEERQGIRLWMGPRLPDGTVEYMPLGEVYQHAGGWRTGENAPTIKWELVDIIGLLANRAYLPPAGEEPTTLLGWLEALAGQLGKNFRRRVRVDPQLAGLPVRAAAGSAKGKNCGRLLLDVCMATGTFPRADAATGYLAAEPVWSEGNKITLDNLVKYPVMRANEDAAAVTVSGYTAPGNLASADRTIEVDNPFLSTMAQKTAAARAILACCGGNRLELTGRGDPAGEVGDVDVVWLDESRAVSARRIMQDLSFSGYVLRNCKSVLLRGDGIYTFTRREKLLKSGTFTVPPGVYRVRVLLVGHGTGGTAGLEGTWVNFWNLGYPRPENGGFGADGSAGSGGKVLDTIVDVNPGQKVAVTVAWESSFGAHSSAQGRVYPGGYTDVSSGEVYGRSGVGNPLPGSGDGGSGGQGGVPGTWYIQGVWHYDDGYVYPGVSEGGVGVDPGHDAPGHWEHEVVIEREPTDGTPGSPGASGCVIVSWEPPEEEGTE